MSVVQSDTEEGPTARVNRSRDPLTSFLIHTRGEEGADVEARLHLQSLRHNYHHGVMNGIAHEYAYGTWGFIVLRIVYTPESDHLFPQAIKKLKKWVHCELHAPRFCGCGAYGESRKMPNPVYNTSCGSAFT
ncbi:uncharacterized protein F5Z01DRAFT_655157 [Emericellopsis atlantica]|uniref:Uncharacterized protein n=1 Tax=Emericellopsis atlantica TaxID=2614577 RepID=A0A9P8CPP4_9HYPO|nr:uncharacterized protein F5Z01DRAFT_655157 [Emericellopsis atlantica]KAG9254340.1 hypothetical protein F5Z01DRAFT_655157 [Emericellopsis atlantica]